MATKRVRPQTPNQGAKTIIAQTVRKVQRMISAQRKSALHDDLRINGYALIDWLRDWDKRAQAKPGGLGRKTKGTK